MIVKKLHSQKTRVSGFVAEKKGTIAEKVGLIAEKDKF